MNKFNIIKTMASLRHFKPKQMTRIYNYNIGKTYIKDFLFI